MTDQWNPDAAPNRAAFQAMVTSDVPLTGDQRRWLRSLVRMAIHKTEKNVDRLAPKSGQSPEEFEEWAAKQAGTLAFRRATLTALEEKKEPIQMPAPEPRFVVERSTGGIVIIDRWFKVKMIGPYPTIKHAQRRADEFNVDHGLIESLPPDFPR